MRRLIVIFVIIVILWALKFLWTVIKMMYRACGNDIHGEYDKDELDKTILRAFESFSAHYNGPNNRVIKSIYWFVFYERFLDNQYRD